MKHVALFLMLAVLALPALAAEEGGHGAAQKAGAPGTNVDMPYLMAPITDADGKLTGYAYIASRLTAKSAGAVLAVRDKLAFIQDAFVRDVNMDPVTKPDQPDTVDIPALEHRLLADVQKIMGAGPVKTITICTIQMSPLRPVPPGAGGPKPPEKSRCLD